MDIIEEKLHVNHFWDLKVKGLKQLQRFEQKFSF